MQIENLEYLIAVHECGSISAAAKKLYMSQPLLSQKIRSLENELGTEIFSRKNYPISLTYAGEQVLQSARQIVKSRNDLEYQLREIKGEERGTLHIGISAHRSIMLTRVIPEYKYRYPNVEICIHEHTPTSFTNLLLENQVNFALISHDHSMDHPELNYEFLHRDRVVLVGSTQTDLARKVLPGGSISIRDAKDETFITVQERFGFRASQNRLFAQQQIDPAVLLSVQSIELACRLAVICNSVTLCTEAHPMETALLKENAFFCYIHDSEYARDFTLAYKKDLFLTKYMQYFIELTKKAYQE